LKRENHSTMIQEAGKTWFYISTILSYDLWINHLDKLIFSDSFLRYMLFLYFKNVLEKI